jgi:hypothetical protein
MSSHIQFSIVFGLQIAEADFAKLIQQVEFICVFIIAGLEYK